MTIAPSQENPFSPFKMNPKWIKYKSSMNNIKEAWETYNELNRVYFYVALPKTRINQRRYIYSGIKKRIKKMKNPSRRWRNIWNFITIMMVLGFQRSKHWKKKRNFL
jgi:hypothetical protein